MTKKNKKVLIVVAVVALLFVFRSRVMSAIEMLKAKFKK